MRTWLLVWAYLLTLSVGAVPAYPSAQAHDTPVEAVSLPEMVQKLTAHTQSDREKAQVLFVWVATHVRYDDSKAQRSRIGFASRQLDTLSAANAVFQSRQGICTDFCVLLYQMYRLAGLRTRIVTGYAKGTVEQAGVPVPSINHQWNMVWLDGCRELLDVTWASTNNGTRPLNLFFFLTPPGQFITTHWPANPADQLLEQPLTKTEFDALPRVYDAYFGQGFGPTFPRQGLYQINRALSLFLPHPANMEFQVVANRYGKPQQERAIYARAYRQKTGYELSLLLLREGLYSVHVLSRPKDAPDDYKLVLTYTVISSRENRKGVKSQKS